MDKENQPETNEKMDDLEIARIGRRLTKEEGQEQINAIAKTFSSNHDTNYDEAVILTRLTSENHDLIKPEEKKKNILVWFVTWWLSWAIPGMGMFSEAYILFSIGNIKPLLAASYPNCYGSAEPSDCNQSAVDQTTNIEICGIIGGMLVIGFAADWIGRKYGSRLCTSIMFVGSIFLTSAAGTAQQFLIVYLIGLFVFGFGVGGEYPMASSSASERAEGNPEMRKRRGETVVLTFTQQGWGNWANALVIIILMAMVGITGPKSEPINGDDAMKVWRSQFGIGAFIVFCLLIYRFTKLEESKVWEAERKGVNKELEIEGEKGNTNKLYWVIFKRNWSRLIATAGAWVVNDLAFYGNKLFQSTFIAILSPDAGLFKQMQWTLLNSTVALCGYFAAAFMVDRPWYGRKRMQMIGFAMMFILFLMCGIFYNDLTRDSNTIKWFQFLYFFSSFWNQFGPNATTWLVAGEVYPTDVRAFYHGFSAACGKAGAIMASEIFTNISDRNTFYVSAAAGAFGVLVTFLFLPDTTGLDLGEIDRFNRYLIAGQAHNYHGEAVNPRYLSFWEKMRGWQQTYDPVLDKEQKALQEVASQALDTVLEED